MTYDLNRIAELLRNEKWTWAKTMPGIPHEYIVRDKCLMGEENFLMIVLAQRDLGTNEIWGKYNFPYLYVDGYKYWTMGDTFENTTILNRQKVFSEFDKLDIQEDDVVPFGVVSHLWFMLRELIEGRYIYEVACGSGGTVKPFLLTPDKYTGIDPSKKAIARFKERYPDFANKIYAISFEESVNYWSNGDYLVLATFGAASYFMEPYLKILDKSGKDYIIMFFQEGKCPKEYEDTHYFHYSPDDIHSIMPTAQVLPYYGYFIASNMNFHEYEVNRIVKWELSHLELLFRKNPFDKDLPYDNLLCTQMESIMSEGDRLFNEYSSFINLHNLRMDLKTIADEYMLFVSKCNEVLPYVEDWHVENFANIIVSAIKRANFFKNI